MSVTKEHFVAEDTTHDADAARQEIDRADLDAPTRVLVWRRFRRHRLGVICFLILAIGYAALPFVEILAPYGPNTFNEDAIYAPPQGLYLYHEGQFVGLHTYQTATVYDLDTGLVRAETDFTRPMPVP
ncbi:MAG: ABC transporter permease, partial [Pseudomonadota bacterium]